MKLHVLSDLHLSLGDPAIPATDADVVVLAGDIARPAQAIAWASRFTVPVLYVLGNHEFYGGTLDGTKSEFMRLSAGTRIQLLDDDETVIGGVRFLGSTLWTDFLATGNRSAAMAEATRAMRDFSRIRTGDTPQSLFTPDDAARRFAIHASWLEAKLGKTHAGPTVVITHHAPSPRSVHPRFAGSLLNASFVSNFERLLDRTRVGLWIHGHTHDSFDYSLNGTRVVCNPRGYAKGGVNENARFDPGLVVEV